MAKSALTRLRRSRSRCSSSISSGSYCFRLGFVLFSFEGVVGVSFFFAGEGRARFAPFLDRLLRRTRGDHAALLLDDGQFSAGKTRPELAALIRTARLRPGRVYALAELTGAEGIAGDARILRLVSGEAPAWLVLAREGECSAADAALLSALGPYVAAALAQHRASLRHAALEQAASTALARAGAG